MSRRTPGIGWQPGTPDDRPPASQDDLDEALTVLAGRRIVVLTGAGFSTDSGLPDYRGPNAKPRHPMTFQQFMSDVAYRRHYWARNHLGWRFMAAVEPNEGHHALALLEHREIVAGVITQNVDRLHQRAGSQNVIDLHGRYDQVVCVACGWYCTRAALDLRLEALNPGFSESVKNLADIEIAPDADVVLTQTEGFVVADCPRCGGILKPDIVYFGEAVPKERTMAAAALVSKGDALLVAGTSLATMSGLRYVRQFANRNLPVVIVNRGLTRADELATVRLNAGTSPVLVYLLSRLKAN